MAALIPHVRRSSVGCQTSMPYLWTLFFRNEHAKNSAAKVTKLAGESAGRSDICMHVFFFILLHLTSVSI